MILGIHLRMLGFVIVVFINRVSVLKQVVELVPITMLNYKFSFI